MINKMINNKFNTVFFLLNIKGAAGQPSTQQLRMLVQQIQMAVQAGYLNHQILNQPLAPTTLVLLNQLLTNIKVSSPLFISRQNNYFSSLNNNFVFY